jgi:hypothetical protein
MIDFSSCNLYKTKTVVKEEEQKLHAADILKKAGHRKKCSMQWISYFLLFYLRHKIIIIIKKIYICYGAYPKIC